MVKPSKTPTFVRALIAEAKRQKISAYRLAKDAGVPMGTAQRLLTGALNPTASTIEAIASALGMVVKVERK